MLVTDYSIMCYRVHCVFNIQSNQISYPGSEHMCIWYRWIYQGAYWIMDVWT